MNINNQGILYIVATPIGNLQDMSLRAIQVLKSVDCIAAEDTRHSLSLMQYFNITTSTLSLHDYNERERSSILLERVKKGESIALISDAGTPLISDPGYFLVREAHVLGIRVVSIPGPCAAIAALSIAGLPTDRFTFEGFLPVKSKGRIDRLKELLYESRTMIFYEAPHRIIHFLEDTQKVFEETRRIVITRELTKVFETVLSGTASELLEIIKKDPNQQRGEMVVLIEGSTQLVSYSPSSEVLTLLLAHLPLKQAVEIASQITGERKNELYELALKIKKTL